jgi:hypothetical protein
LPAYLLAACAVTGVVAGEYGSALGFPKLKKFNPADETFVIPDTPCTGPDCVSVSRAWLYDAGVYLFRSGANEARVACGSRT